jgi:hypothetical protein
MAGFERFRAGSIGLRMSRVTWILEAEVFPRSHSAMCEAVIAAECELLMWSDEWLAQSKRPDLEGKAVVFHGSLGNASVIRSGFPWKPGAFCDTARFRCSSWYPQAKSLLLHQRYQILPVNELVADPPAIAASLGAADSVFVRPDSPLKPFSGRVVRVDSLSLRALDFGFYFDNETLPVVVAPVRAVSREWRYVIVNGAVIAGSAYEAASRTAVSDTPHRESWQFAERVAQSIPAPEPAYVLDICESDGRMHVLELNPFSGADLYACDRPAIVNAVSRLAREIVG